MRGVRVSARITGISVHASVALVISLFCHSAVNAAEVSEPLTIDDLGFNSAMDGNVFVDRYQIEGESIVVSPLSGVKPALGIHSTVEIASASRRNAAQGLNFSEDVVNSAEGFRVRRFSTALKGEKSTLTVGKDWSNFQEFLGPGQRSSNIVANAQEGVAEQILWRHRSGFAVAVENDLEYDLSEGSGSSSLRDQNAYLSTPSLILSWGSNQLPVPGRYSFSALGRQLQLEGFDETASPKEEIGWGVNIAGGWQFGDLFAALSITLGNSIDNIILGRIGGQGNAAASRVVNLGNSYNINPSINYRLGDGANIHVAINRFASNDGNSTHGVDTLDTVHLGYTWNPWPSTRFGIEFVGKDVAGRSELSDSNQVNFAASKRF